MKYIVKPVFSRVLVELQDFSKVTTSIAGFELASKYENTGYKIFKILGMGPEAFCREGRNIHPEIKVGQLAICKQEHVIKFTTPDKVEHCWVPDDQFLAFIETESK